MSNSQNKSAPITPLRNADGTFNLTHYRNKAQTERANTINWFGKIIQALIGFQR